jgi:hypothetical protein
LRRSRWPLAGSPLASLLRRVEQAPLPEADALLALFALLEPPSLAEHDRLIPMRRVPLADELREYPWGEAPLRVRPGELLPTVTPAASPLPLFIPSDGQRGIASRFGRTDELGRVEPDERSAHGAHRPRDVEPGARGDERDIPPLPRK